MPLPTDSFRPEGARNRIWQDGELIVDFDARKCGRCGVIMETFGDVFYMEGQGWPVCRNCAARDENAVPYLHESGRPNANPAVAAIMGAVRRAHGRKWWHTRSRCNQ